MPTEGATQRPALSSLLRLLTIRCIAARLAPAQDRLCSGVMRIVKLSLDPKFNVIGPTAVNVEVTTGNVEVRDLRFGYYGKDGTLHQEIKFNATATQPANRSGKLLFVQFLSRDQAMFSGGPEHIPPCTFGNGLDGGFPYPPEKIIETGQPKAVTTAADGPDVLLNVDYAVLRRIFEADMQLFWQSSKPNSIPVPLGHVGWNIDAVARRPPEGGPYQLERGVNQGHSSFSSLADLPRWSNVRINGEYSCKSQ